MAEQSQSVSQMPPAATPVDRRSIGTSVGAVAAALLASVCCMGPMLFVTIGVGAGFARMFEPLRPVFTILTVALVAAGFYAVYGRRKAPQPDATCGTDGVCAAPFTRTRDKLAVWLGALIALLLLTFPRWSLWII
jgi:mercuric ion transport protein